MLLLQFKVFYAQLTMFTFQLVMLIYQTSTLSKITSMQHYDITSWL